jgi:hypothetical protein
MKRILHAVTAAALAVLVTPVALAAPSHAVFAFSGIGGEIARLELTTDTGVHNLDATTRGWIQLNGTSNGASPTNNYLAGLCGSSDSCGAGDTTHRNWFVFDLVTTAFSNILSARLLLTVPDPGGGDQGVYVAGGDPLYTLRQVTTPISAFTSDTAGAAGFVDLGDGTTFGSRTYTLADQGTLPAITLNASAVAYLNTRIGSDAILGGHVDQEFAPVAPTLPVPASSPAALALLALLLAVLAFAVTRRPRARRG